MVKKQICLKSTNLSSTFSPYRLKNFVRIQNKLPQNLNILVSFMFRDMLMRALMIKSDVHLTYLTYLDRHKKQHIYAKSDDGNAAECAV